MLRGLELQFRTRSRLIETKEGEALSIQFCFGPIAIFIIANLPESEEDHEQPLAYVKVTLQPNVDWPVFKEHNGMSRHTRKEIR